MLIWDFMEASFEETWKNCAQCWREKCFNAESVPFQPLEKTTLRRTLPECMRRKGTMYALSAEILSHINGCWMRIPKESTKGRVPHFYNQNLSIWAPDILIDKTIFRRDRKNMHKTAAWNQNKNKRLTPVSPLLIDVHACAILAVSALKTLNELSQNPHARMKRLSTVTTKHECRIRTRWLKLSPRWRRTWEIPRFRFYMTPDNSLTIHQTILVIPARTLHG